MNLDPTGCLSARKILDLEVWALSSITHGWFKSNLLDFHEEGDAEGSENLLGEVCHGNQNLSLPDVQLLRGDLLQSESLCCSLIK